MKTISKRRATISESDGGFEAIIALIEDEVGTSKHMKDQCFLVGLDKELYEEDSNLVPINFWLQDDRMLYVRENEGKKKDELCGFLTRAQGSDGDMVTVVWFTRKQLAKFEEEFNQPSLILDWREDNINRCVNL